MVVGPGDTQTVTVGNPSKGSLIVRKIDSVTKEPLAGVKFKITTSNGDLVPDHEGTTSTNGLYSTDENGEIVLSKIPPDTYIVEEIETIPGYIASNESQTVQVSSDDAQTLTFTNTPKGSLIVRKIDSVTKEPLEGVEFRIVTDKGDLVMDNEGATSTNGLYKADNKGEIALSKLNPGTYVVTETATIPGYILNPESQTVNVGANDSQTLTFTNEPMGALVIKNMDSLTKEPLSEVVFKVTGIDGTVVGSSNGEFRTDESGIITITGLAPGGYTVQEIQTKEGYIIDDTPRSIEIKDHQSYTLEFFNEPKGGLVIHKIDSVTKKPLQGVEFSIMTSDGKLITTNNGHVSSNGRYVTNENGDIVLTGIDPGTYVVTETKTVDGYVMDSEPQTVVVNATDTQTIVFTNAPKGSLNIRKIDSVTKEPLQGVEFKITNSNGDLVSSNEGATSTNGIYKTDENGEIVLGNLKPDTYVVTETATIPGYIMDAESQTVKVDTNDAQTVTFTNTPKGGLFIKKVDASTREPLSDVLFKVTASDGSVVGTSNGEYRTDANGYITINGLPNGTYTVQELETKSGYVLDSTPKTIEIKDYQTYTLEFVNQPNGGIVIRKVDSVTKEPLQGVEFSIETIDGQPVADNNGQTSTNGRYVTNEVGEIVLNSVAPGIYVITETKTINGYVATKESQTVIVDPNDVQTLTFTNPPKGSLVVRKIDSVTKEPLEGVKFKITNSAGDLVSSDEGATSSNGLYVTNENGEIAIPNIQPDTYVVTEVETIPGYIMDAEPQTVKVNESDAQVLTFTNSPTGALVIKKMDYVTKEPLSEVTFKVTTLDGTVVGTSNGEFRTDSSGYIVINDVKPGSYVIQEIKTKSGYILDDIARTIEVKDHETYTLELFNKPKGGIVIRKIDSDTKAPLKGVEFKVTTASGELVATNEGLTGSNGNFVTDNNGQILIDNLTPGTYIVTEIKALDGYIIDTEPQTVVVGETGMQTLTFTNTKKGSLVIKKIDSKSKKPLAGVEFEIVGSNGCEFPASTYTTDNNGVIRLDNIPSGMYNITEKKTIEGYLLNSATQTTMVTKGNTTEVTIENDPLGGLLIQIMDKITKEPLPEATVKITNADGSPVGTSGGIFVTDSRGYISVPGLAPGSYTVTQISTKSGYIIDSTPHNVVIKDNGTYTLDIYNMPKGSLVIRKIDKVSKNPLEGVEFRVTNTNGELVANNEGSTSTNGMYKTNASGEIRINNLTPGSYTVTETNTIDGYAMDAPAQTVVVNAGDTQTLTFEDSPLGGLLIKAMSATTKEPLPNVIYNITTIDGTVIGTSNGEFKTNGYGNISIPNLQPGGYIVTMTQACKGYILESAPRTINIKDSQTYTLEYLLQPQGGLIIHKIDSVTKQPLEGVEFRVTTSSGELVATNEGAISSNGIYKTDASGEIVLNKLLPGTYVVTETKTLDGYMIDETPQTVRVIEGDTQTLTFENAPGGSLVVRAIDSITKSPISDVEFEVKSYTDTNYPAGSHTTDISGAFRVDGVNTGTYTVTLVKVKDGYYIDNTVQTIQVNSGEASELIFELNPLGGLVIKVLDAMTKIPLEDSLVKVTTSDGEVIGEANGEYRTNTEGTITIAGIAPGSYIVQQLSAKKGYIMDETPKTIEVRDTKTYTVEILNKVQGSLIIRMIDASTKLPMSGVEFKITNSSGELVATNGGLTSSNGIYMTDINGEILLNMLAEGTYVVTQYGTINGVKTQVASQTVMIGKSDTQILTFTNTSLNGVDTSVIGGGNGVVGGTNVGTGGLIIKLIDASTRQPVKNALFSITKTNGEIINARAETDINGLITLTDLEAGSYIITQTKAADGYTELADPMTVVVNAGKPTEVVITIGQSLGMQIRAVVKGTTTTLEGCKFKVTKVNGEIVGSYVTDSSGLININNLEDGVYVVTQISGPEGYKLCATSQNVIIASGKFATVEFEIERMSGIRIKNIDVRTKKGIYHSTFLVEDESGNTIGKFTTDQDGYAELGELTTDGKSVSKIKVTQIEAAEGYVLDKTVRTLRINRGETTEMVIESTPILGQIQIVVKASQTNNITNHVAGDVLSGAVFEIIDPVSNRVVDTVTSNEHGIAASNPLPIGRYHISQITAPRFYRINSRKVEATLKIEGDVVQVVMYNDPAAIKTTITQTVPKEITPGTTMRYDISNVANQSNIFIDNFFWHDRIPTDAVRVGTITTGTYSSRVWYKITYKTNQNDYRTLAENLLSTNNYSYKIDAASLKLAIGEYVTDVRYEFGTVPSGFRMVEKASIYVTVPTYMRAGYGIINRVDAGGSYQGEWDSSTASATTKIVAASPVIVTIPTPAPAIPTPSTNKLPQTGY